MIFKIVVLFLVGMGVLAMFGKLTAPRRLRGAVPRCRHCGRHRIGKGPCPCSEDRSKG